MSHGYVTVQWKKQKKVYDLCLWLGILVFLGVFIGVSMTLYTGDQALSPMIVIIRALATCAFVMLTIILCIGPLARLDKRFLPLLYNRRHFGVSMFLIALVHGALAIMWYHGFGVANPIVSVFTSNGEYQIVTDFPFQALGALALVILFLMASTSHDFWNANLGAPFWKALHMLVYVAYALLIAHVALGAMQEDNTGLVPMMVLASIVLVGGLHVAAALKSRAPDQRLIRTDGEVGEGAGNEWLDVGAWQNIPNDRAITVTVGADERIAVFRYDTNKLAAVTNACQHQNGPLGEGRVIDGCITCPWHGYQYRPEDGCSPPPFTEKIETYRLKLEGDRVLLDPNPLAKGTARPIVEIPIIDAASTDPREVDHEPA